MAFSCVKNLIEIGFVPSDNRGGGHNVADRSRRCFFCNEPQNYEEEDRTYCFYFYKDSQQFFLQGLCSCCEFSEDEQRQIQFYEGKYNDNVCEYCLSEESRQQENIKKVTEMIDWSNVQ